MNSHKSIQHLPTLAAKRGKTRYSVWVGALLILALILTACSTPAGPPEQQATDGATTATGGDPGAADTEADTEAEAEDEEDDDANRTVIESSQGAQGRVEAGVVVEGTEDISTPRTQHGGEMRSTSTSEIKSFHPYDVSDSASFAAQGNVWDSGLLRLDENTLQYIPNMAHSYSISEDGLTYTFHLHEDMTWTDGEPITAHDFQFAYDNAIKPENEYPYVSQLSFITSYKALDDYTLEIQITEPYCPALCQMSGLLTPLPKHVWEDLDWRDPVSNPEILNPTVTSGPYKLVEWQPAQYSVFEANEDYWYHGAPNITRQTDEIVPDTDIAFQRFKNGESDIYTPTPEQVEETRTLSHATLYEYWPAAASWSYIGLNMRERFVTSDINVRHGLNYAIDKEVITDEVMLGQAKRLCSAFPETSWVYNPDVPCYDYDQEQAIAEFAKSGYTYDGSTMRGPDGQPVTLKLIYGPNTNKSRELIAIAVQSDLAKIGVAVEIQAMEWQSFLDTIHSNDSEWDMMIAGWNATLEPHIMFTIWAEASIPQLNSVGYVNKEVEDLFTQAGYGACNVDERKAIYGEIQRIIAEDSPYIFLFYTRARVAVNNRVQGIDPRPIGVGWNSLDWYIVQEE